MNFNNCDNKVYVAILSGGLSSRIGGGIKTLKTFNNKTIFERIFSNLTHQCKNIIINTNEDDFLFREYNALIVKDVFLNRVGPLGGIHACLNWLKLHKQNIEWLVTVPSDTPFLPKNLVKNLIYEATNEKYKIILSKSNGKVHPIIGIWHSSLLENLEKEINLGTRKILHWAEKHSIGYVEFNNSRYDHFFNINHKEDILKAEEIENNELK